MNCDSWFGIPTSIFDMALLWQPTAKSVRRLGFPSWSWAGWTGSFKWYGDTMELVSYGINPSEDLVKSKITDWLRQHTYIDWKTAGGVMVWNAEMNTEKIGDRDTVGYDHLKSTTGNPYGRPEAQCKIYAKYPRESPWRMPTTKSQPWQINSQHYLCFSALVIPLRIVPSPSSYLRYASIDPVWEPRGRLIFHLLNKLSQKCGYVLLDDSWTTNGRWDPERTYDFVILSAANYYSDWGRPHDGHPYTNTWGMTEYIERHVMMIVEVEEGVWERVGLGRVHGEAIEDGWGEGARWRDVVLA